MKIKKRQITVKGSKWQYAVLPDNKYVALYGSDEEATIDPKTNTIYFHRSSLTWGVVRHEWRHLYNYELNTHSANLTRDQQEEIDADLDNYSILQMLQQSAKVYLTLCKDCGIVDNDPIVQQVVKWRIK